MTVASLPVDTHRRAQLIAAVQAAALADRDDPTQASRTRTPRVLPRTQKSGQVNTTAVAFNVFANLLATDGVRAALYSLLRLTDYRFISIFRFENGKATSAVHVDRENLAVLQADEVPDTATYCCYVRDSNGSFVTADASQDERTQTHVARDVIRAYCGIPILDPEGVLIGTLCHYDTVARDPEQLDLELLLQAASALAAPGVVPPYPTLA